MADYRLTQSGDQVQEILNNAAMQSDLTAEQERAELAEQTLQNNIDAEALAREQADGVLDGKIDANTTRIINIEGKIPSGASTENKLTTESEMNSAIATATATFRGTYNLVSDLGLAVSATHEQIATALAGEIATADNNDYCFVQVPTSESTPTQIAKIERYKFNGTAWAFEYELNNSGFTAEQWAAINSGIVSADVAKLALLPTSSELTALLNGKQNVLSFDTAPTPSSTNPVTSGGVYTAIDNEKGARLNADAAMQQAIEGILLLIPSAATALNQLADKAFVNSSVSTNTATFRGTYNSVTDLGLGVDATHAQIAAALANVITSQVDNNDYAFVQIPTAVGTPTEIAKTERYKFNGTAWAFEYELNTSGFTAAQWAAINSGIIAAFIPSETTAANPLADKAYVLAQILAATPSFKGQFTSLADLQAVASPKAGDLGIVRTKDSDGYDVFTFYQYLNNQWNVYFTLSHHNQKKPATTGTTGDYPYNGMGRVVLPMNIKEIGGVTANYLEQSMMPTAIGGNTIYVITHDYVMASDVTIPANCVLEFEGGSISGSYTLTGNGTGIVSPDVKCLDVNTTFAGTWRGTFNAIWLGLVSNDSTFDNAPLIQKAFRSFTNIYIPNGDYYCSTTIECSRHTIGLSTNRKFSVMCDGNLYYTAERTSNRFICIGSETGEFVFNGFINGPGVVDGGTPEQSIGISLYDCGFMNVRIAHVFGFGTGVEFLGGFLGCAYNYFEIGRVGNCRVLVHFNTLLKEQSSQQDGWVNSNEFKFLSLFAFGGQYVADTAILFQGVGGNASFNDNLISKLSIENIKKIGAGAPIKIYNGHDITIADFRDEVNNTPLIKLFGTCGNIFLKPSYYNHNKDQKVLVDADKDTIYSQDFFGTYRFTINPYQGAIKKGANFYLPFAYDFGAGHLVGNATGPYYPLCVLFQAGGLKNKPFNVSVPSVAIWHIFYYDENHNMLSMDDYSDYAPILSTGINASNFGGGWKTNQGAHALTVLIPSLPSIVAYIAIGAVVQGANRLYANDFLFSFDSFIWGMDRYIDNSLVEEKYKNVNQGGYRLPYSSKGTTTQRPTADFAEEGMCYFDESLSPARPIWVKEIDTSGENPVVVWVDATGEMV